MVFNQIQFDNYTLDVDSSVITRYGIQEGSMRGYNPKKPGRNRGVEGFCMDDFCATETAMRFVMVAYNLMSLFRLLTSQKQPSPKLSTLRFNCFAVGSWVEEGDQTHSLKMSVPLKRRQWYDSLFSYIQNAKLPLSLTG